MHFSSANTESSHFDSKHERRRRRRRWRRRKGGARTKK
jgi:hypothetical protein